MFRQRRCRFRGSIQAVCQYGQKTAGGDRNCRCASCAARPGLCWPCTLLGCCVAAEGWAGVRLSYASRPRYACERCSAMRLATCGACLCRPARFPDGVVEERAYERGLGSVWLGWRRLGLDELLLLMAQGCYRHCSTRAAWKIMESLRNRTGTRVAGQTTSYDNVYFRARNDVNAVFIKA